MRIAKKLQRGLPGMVLALLASGPVWAGDGMTTITAPDLSVEGTAFVLRQADGQVLRGVELEGAVLHMGVEGGAASAVKLASITPDPDDPEILRHEFQVEKTPGHWQPICMPTVDGETWGVPIALPEGHPGRDGPITLSCASGAVGKCLRFGYKPWDRGHNGESLLPYHAACVHMVRADYCGDSQPHTKNGTYIKFHDRAVRWMPAQHKDPEYVFEAGWAPAGAVCVARTRWPELGTVEAIRQSCPRLAQAGVCDETTAAAKGALIFNESRAKPRLGR